MIVHVKIGCQAAVQWCIPLSSSLVMASVHEHEHIASTSAGWFSCHILWRKVAQHYKPKHNTDISKGQIVSLHHVPLGFPNTTRTYWKREVNTYYGLNRLGWACFTTTTYSVFIAEKDGFRLRGSVDDVRCVSLSWCYHGNGRCRRGERWSVEIVVANRPDLGETVPTIWLPSQFSPDMTFLCSSPDFATTWHFWLSEWANFLFPVHTSCQCACVDITIPVDNLNTACSVSGACAKFRISASHMFLKVKPRYALNSLCAMRSNALCAKLCAAKLVSYVGL